MYYQLISCILARAKYLCHRQQWMVVPAKNVASVLNNESNLRILEKLKERPYYPRELAAEMGLSEPFIVRRLKAMEEHDIVEGRWDTEGTRKVKRYYVKDVTIRLGKDGLQVKTAEKPHTSGVDLKKDLIGRLIKLPLAIMFVAGVIFNIPILLVVMSIFLAWYTAIYYANYGDFKYKTSLLSCMISGILAGFTLVLIALEQLSFNVPEYSLTILLVVSMIVIFLAIYQARYYQLEFDAMVEDLGEFVHGLDKAPLYKKLFYLPMVAKWKISEYFGLI